MPSDHVIVLTTLPETADAEALAQALVEERLAACVNVLPVMTSIYIWQDTVQREPERQVVIKTSRRRLPALWSRLKQLHPYDLPELLVLDIAGGDEGYLRWVEASTDEAGTQLL